MGIKQRLVAELRETTGMSHADAKRVVEARRAAPAAIATAHRRVLHLDQILMAVARLPQWLHRMRYRGIPSAFEVPVTSWRIVDTTIPPNGVPNEAVPERVLFTRDGRGNWHFEGRVAVMERELALDTMPAHEAVRGYAKQRVDRLSFDGIARISAKAQPMNEYRNIPIDLELEVLGPSERAVLARDHHNTPLIDIDADIECVSAEPIVFEEPQPSLNERAGVLYLDDDAGTGADPEPYPSQSRRKLRDCKPGETVFAPISGGARTWHPLRVAFCSPSPSPSAAGRLGAG